MQKCETLCIYAKLIAQDEGSISNKFTHLMPRIKLLLDHCEFVKRKHFPALHINYAY